MAPGAVMIPLHDALPKHSMIPCTRADQVNQKTSLGWQPPRNMTFHAAAHEPAPPSPTTANNPKTTEAATDVNNAEEASHWQHVAPDRLRQTAETETTMPND